MRHLTPMLDNGHGASNNRWEYERQRRLVGGLFEEAIAAVAVLGSASRGGIVAVAQWFLVVVFAGAAATKLSDRERFVKTLLTAPWLSLRLARLASVGVPLLELLVAGALAVFPMVGAASGLAALCLFTSVIVVELLAGREFRCGCFGGADGRPAGWLTIVRNAALAAAAGSVITFPAEAEVAAALVGGGIGLMFILFEVGVETLMVARAR